MARVLRWKILLKNTETRLRMSYIYIHAVLKTRTAGMTQEEEI